MILQKYLGDSKMFEYEKFYRECQHLNKPFIKSRINPSNGNFFVQIDLMTCNYDLTQLELDEINKLILNEIEFVKLHTPNSFNDYHIDKEVAWFDGISSEHIHNFCENLYDLTQKYHN